MSATNILNVIKNVHSRSQPSRSFSVCSGLKSNIFNVQDTEDFKTKVLDNKKPVIVDFHAV